MVITTLADLESVLIDLATAESSALFAQGDALALACEPDTRARLGLASDAAVLQHAGETIGRGRRTMYNRLKVARTFAPSERVEWLTWSTHLAAANSSSPHLWLTRAADERWSHTQLQTAIAVAQADDPDETETIVVARAIECVARWRDGALVLEGLDGIDIHDGEMCAVTIAVDRALEHVQIVAHKEKAA